MSGSNPREHTRTKPIVWRLVLAIALLGLFAGTAAAQPAAAAQWRIEDQPHADVPFELDLMIEGFDESPAPVQPKLELPNATVTPMGVTPNSQRSIQIVNGRRTESVRITWVMRWRVVVHKAGALRIPALAVSQGSKQATPRSGDITVDTVATTDDMKLELQLPGRPVFVGETVPIKLVWLFRAQPQDQTFSIPMMSSDAFTISGPPVPDPRKALTFAAGTKDLQLPYEIDEATVGGVRFKRLTTTFYAAPRTVPAGGKVELAPSSVVAALAVGRPDFFGNAATRLFRSLDIARTLEVKPLPETDKPGSFAGAVGEQYSIEVRTSRSVVQLGEPVELAITVKSDQRLDNLALAKLDGDGGLPRDKFTVPAESPTGELSADGKTKLFKVVAQVTGPATEVPAIAFSYFDPKQAAYRTIRSEPIALSVKGGTVVGAGDVVSSSPQKKVELRADDDAVIAQLALSAPGQVDDQPLSGVLLWLLVGLLYAIPIGILVVRSWQLGTADKREDAAEVRAARRRAEELLDRAVSTPAREIAGPLTAALRELARVLEREVDDRGLLARLETESFAPEAAEKPFSPDLRSDAAGLLRRWVGEARRGGKSKKAAVVAGMLVFGFVGLAGEARADALADGRTAYQDAMALTGDPTGRKAAFSRAAVALGQAAREQPGRPELLTDLGNAALGAGDVAAATLAYRRALAIDASNARARKNLAWLRGRQPDGIRPIESAGATDTLLFFHRWPRTQRILVGAAAFAIAILLLVPWSGQRRRSLAAVAAIPLAIWLVMLISILFEDRHEGDAVVMDAVTLRAADSAGAPAALSQPLPRGAEVEILERRGGWNRIQVASGTTGWVPEGAVETVLR